MLAKCPSGPCRAPYGYGRLKAVSGTRKGTDGRVTRHAPCSANNCLALARTVDVMSMCVAVREGLFKQINNLPLRKYLKTKYLTIKYITQSNSVEVQI